MKKPVMMETMNGILAVVVVPVVVAGRRTVVVGAVVVAETTTAVVGAVVVAETTTAVVGAVVVAETTTAVVGAVVALVIIIVWSIRRKMRITMTTMVGTMALVFVVATIMMMAAIEGQAAAIAVVMIAAGRVALRTHRNETAKMYCLCRY
jgi:hypothetical protein